MDATTIPPAPVTTTITVEIAHDATPIVRLLGRTLRDAVRTGHAPDVLGHGAGTVAVRSHDTPQAATVTFSDGAVTVTGGVFAPTDATVVVDLDARLATVSTEGDADLADGLSTALRPPLPSWQEAATRFWDLTRGIRGIPDVLVAVADGPGGPEEARFGAGPTCYRMVATPDVLTGVFTGSDYLLSALDRGLRVQGTLSQLSVMTAASWKVRFDV